MNETGREDLSRTQGKKKRHEMFKPGRMVPMQNKEKLLTYLTVLEMNNTTYHRVVTDPWGISKKN